MTPKQTRPLIVKALRFAKDYPPKGGIEEMADRIVAEFETFEQCMQDGGLLITAPPVVQYSAPVRLVEQASVAAINPVQQEEAQDIFRRIGTPAPHMSDDEVKAVKDRVVMDYRAVMPPSIIVQPPGFDKPIVLIQHRIGGYEGAAPFVEISYVLQGATTSAAMTRSVVNVLQSIPTAEALQEEIKQQAGMLFSATPKTVVARVPLPQGDWMSNAVTDTIDEHVATPPKNWMETKGEPFSLQKISDF